MAVKKKKKVTKKKTGAAPDFIKDHALVEHQEIEDNLPKDQLKRLSLSLERMLILKQLHADNKTKNAKVWAEFEKYEQEAMGLLKENNLPSFSNDTHKISVTVKTSIKTPKTDEDKSALFKWIKKKKGAAVLLAYQSINSISLNKFYNTEAALHFEETGKTSFIMDGVEPPSSIEKLSLRKAGK